MKTSEAYTTKDGTAVLEFTIELAKRGPMGAIGCALFRAYNNSSRAKRKRRGGRERYSNKNDSLKSLCTSLLSFEHYHGFEWGWGVDRATTGYENVLYIDLVLPEGPGQVSFHSGVRYDGPDYDKPWDGKPITGERIAAYCDWLIEQSPADMVAMPFGKYCGVPLSDVDDGYWHWVNTKSTFSADFKQLLEKSRLLTK